MCQHLYKRMFFSAVAVPIEGPQISLSMKKRRDFRDHFMQPCPTGEKGRLRDSALPKVTLLIDVRSKTRLQPFRPTVSS